jgi:ATP-binding cassette subfamily C protein LapB
VKLAGLRKYVETTTDGLDQIIDQSGSSLALGIRRRVAIARALATQGQLVLFDEPTAGLDSEGCDTIYNLLNILNKANKTIIVVSHDPAIIKAASLHIDLTTKPTPVVRARATKKDVKPDQNKTMGNNEDTH